MGKTKKTNDTTTFTLSHSSLSSMEQCLRKWFLRYVGLHYIKSTKPWSDFGLLMHHVAEHYSGEGKEYMIREAKSYIKEKNLDIHPDYKPKIPIALKNLKKFYDRYLANARKVFKEKEFRIELTEYVDLIGLVDVLYQNEAGEWVIADFKTSKKKGNHEKQLFLYFYLICQSQGKFPPYIKAQIVYPSLDDGSTDLDDIVQEHIIYESDLKHCERRILSALQTIGEFGNDSSRWGKTNSKLCDYCEFYENGLCDAGKKEY